MKLKQVWINCEELQDYLDKYGEYIIHMLMHKQFMSDINGGNKIILVINVGKLDANDPIFAEAQDVIGT